MRRSLSTMLVVLGMACANEPATKLEKEQLATSEFERAKQLVLRINTTGMDIAVCQDAINHLQHVAHMASIALEDTASTTSQELIKVSHAFAITAQVIAECSKDKKVLSDVINTSANPSRRRELVEMANAIELVRVWQ